MILTILETRVPPERVPDLQAAFDAERPNIPPGFVRSHLICAADDTSLWRIETLWTSRDALTAMRQMGTPAGVRMFRAAGAEPTLSILEVRATIEAPPG
jgi:hypothetical protein